MGHMAVKEDNRNSPATDRQTWALFLHTGYDVRRIGLTMEVASRMISKCQGGHKNGVIESIAAQPAARLVDPKKAGLPADTPHEPYDPDKDKPKPALAPVPAPEPEPTPEPEPAKKKTHKKGEGKATKRAARRGQVVLHQVAGGKGGTMALSVPKAMVDKYNLKDGYVFEPTMTDEGILFRFIAKTPEDAQPKWLRGDE